MTIPAVKPASHPDNCFDVLRLLLAALVLHTQQLLAVFGFATASVIGFRTASLIVS